MRLTFWGTRGSLPSPGASTARHGGNTSCVEVRTSAGNLVVLDAGTGIAALGRSLGPEPRIDVLLSHLHLDHIQGLGFFAPLFEAGVEVHVWGPSSTTLDLRARLTRYLSPPLFPVGLRDLAARVALHDVPLRRFELPGVTVEAALVCHPGPTVGYRLTDADGSTLAYLSDHEPALGATAFPEEPSWTSGFALAVGADVLVHDAQYTVDEYRERVGWGHSTLDQAIAFAELAEVGRLVAFHHDPDHDDTFLDRFLADRSTASLEVTAAREGESLDVAAIAAARPSRTASG